MGYNRGGHRRTQRLKRQRREQRRLAMKAQTAQPGKSAAAGKG
jgi:hypothetical protein